MRASRLSVWWVAISLALVVLAACGRGEGERVRSTPATKGPEWMAGEPFSSLYALQILEAPEVGAVVVDTAAEVEGVRRVQARWQADAERTVVTDLERPALIFPWAWAGMGRIYVSGFACPEPTLDDIDLLDVDRVAGCGGHPVSYVIRVFDVEAGSWSEVDVSIPAANGRTVNVLSAGTSRAIFSAGDERDTSQRVIYQVDLATGSRTIIAGDAEGLSMCESGSAQLGIRGAEIDANGEGAPGRFVLVTNDGVRDLDATTEGTAVKLGCTDGAMVLWLPEDRIALLARQDGGVVTQDRLEMPAGASGIRVVAQRNLARTVAVWEDQGTSFQLRQLRDERWSRCGLRADGVDPPNVVAVTDCVAITADPRSRSLDVRS